MGSKKEVVESIKGNGLIPLSVEAVASNFFSEINKKIKGRVNLKQVSTFTRQLSTMMTAGLPLTDALALLKNQQSENDGLYQVLEKTLEEVRAGMPLGKSLEKYKNIFGEAYVASISAGEEAGVLDEVLGKLATNLENQNEFQGKVKGAMIYPVIVIVAMIIVVFIMMIFVIPKLTGLYADFGTAKMPAATQALMSVSAFMAKTWYLFPVLIAGGYFAYSVGIKSEKFRLKKDSLLLKIPIVGVLNEKSIMANTCRTFSMLLTAGITLVEALKIVATVSGNEVYKKAYLQIAEKVQKGFSVATSFENTSVFPIIVNQMISTGEATGKLDDVLMRVSDYFSKEAEESVKALTAAIEPAIMIILGIGVGFLVIAVVMPIYNLTSSF
ncbi:MAG: Type II secretion system F domain protein [Candidatus Shapirobacteria bacterium GW2011_GWE1_38_10]|uniref:Type II secretion system F domain protein n=1 Tax=Candidatus Shapirobacteria bacterium GW2011_GWE1_38_10 TaxID=1618488 RepID=A0A0G0I707_9BACT|nr:MAG: Type II secretion system F domain protein [Candidatus Shapirobacteria bacterium GW2011_GWE1_38_10]